MPESRLVHGRIESNSWHFTITQGHGPEFDLISKPLRENKVGTYVLCEKSEAIIKGYPDSVYAPYAMTCEIDRLLSQDGGEQPVQQRRALADGLMRQLRRDHADFAYLDILELRYADRLQKIGDSAAASAVVNSLKQHEVSAQTKQYIARVWERLSE